MDKSLNRDRAERGNVSNFSVRLTFFCTRNPVENRAERKKVGVLWIIKV